MSTAPESLADDHDVWQRPFVRLHRRWCPARLRWGPTLPARNAGPPDRSRNVTPYTASNC